MREFNTNSLTVEELPFITLILPKVWITSAERFCFSSASLSQVGWTRDTGDLTEVTSASKSRDDDVLGFTSGHEDHRTNENQHILMNHCMRCWKKLRKVIDITEQLTALSCPHRAFIMSKNGAVNGPHSVQFILKGGVSCFLTYAIHQLDCMVFNWN